MSEARAVSTLALRDIVQADRPITYGIVQPGDFVSDGIPLVRGRDYSNGWHDLSEIVRVRPDVEQPYRRARLRPGDLLMTIVGAGTGNTAVVPDFLDGANITQTTARIAVDDQKADAEYVLAVLRSTIGRRLVHRYVKGAAQPGLNLGDIEQFLIPLPIRDTQRVVATVARTWDAAIDVLGALIAEVRLLKDGLLDQTFGGRSSETGANRPDWVTRPASEIFNISIGGTPRRDEPTYWATIGQDGYPWLSIGDIKSRRLSATAERITSAGVASSNTKLVHPGTVVMSFKLTIGRCGIATVPMFTNEAIAAFEPRQGEVDPDFLVELLSRVDFDQFTDLAAKGATLNKSKLRDINLTMPSIEEQRRIGAFSRAADDEIRLLEAQVSAYARQKEGLMQKLLTNEWLLSEAQDLEAAE
jgi:type I restriction enzyme S subunit